jgi:hypothetical protein
MQTAHPAPLLRTSEPAVTCGTARVWPRCTSSFALAEPRRRKAGLHAGSLLQGAYLSWSIRNLLRESPTEVRLLGRVRGLVRGRGANLHDSACVRHAIVISHSTALRSAIPPHRDHPFHGSHRAHSGRAGGGYQWASRNAEKSRPCVAWVVGAEERTRTSTTLRPQAPEAWRFSEPA